MPYHKELANEAIYNVRQFYFRKKRYLNYYENWKLLKNNSVNYNKLQTHVAQQVIQQVDTMFQSFFALLKLKKSGKYSQKVRLLQYLHKDGFIALTIVDFNLKKCTLSIPYVYEATEEQRKLDKTKALAIDLGIDNLAACATSMCKTFIIDGRRLKSINQWYNKENSRLQSINDKQKQKLVTRQQTAITRKRNNRVNDYMSKTARKIINYCLENGIGVVVCGYNPDFQRYSDMGRVTNQQFVKNIPFSKLRQKLKYLCELYGEYHEQEESYTSKASFWDKDEMPIYKADNRQRYEFSGSRIHRGLYRTSTGFEFNADVNGSVKYTEEK